MFEGNMQRKIFWATFIGLSLITDVVLPLLWAFVLTIPIIFLSWWFAYRSGWIE